MKLLGVGMKKTGSHGRVSYIIQVQEKPRFKGAYGIFVSRRQGRFVKHLGHTSTKNGPKNNPSELTFLNRGRFFPIQTVPF